METEGVYRIIYWLPGQSKLFSEPQVYETPYAEDYQRALDIAEENGYEVEQVEYIER